MRQYGNTVLPKLKSKTLSEQGMMGYCLYEDPYKLRNLPLRQSGEYGKLMMDIVVAANVRIFLVTAKTRHNPLAHIACYKNTNKHLRQTILKTFV
jgi:hypothetical protein